MLFKIKLIVFYIWTNEKLQIHLDSIAREAMMVNFEYQLYCTMNPLEDWSNTHQDMSVITYSVFTYLDTVKSWGFWPIT